MGFILTESETLYLKRTWRNFFRNLSSFLEPGSLLIDGTLIALWLILKYFDLWLISWIPLTAFILFNVLAIGGAWDQAKRYARGETWNSIPRMAPYEGLAEKSPPWTYRVYVNRPEVTGYYPEMYDYSDDDFDTGSKKGGGSSYGRTDQERMFKSFTGFDMP